MIYQADPDATIYQGDVVEELALLETDSVDACVTSPPYLDARPEYRQLAEDAWELTFYELRRVVKRGALVNVGRLWREGRELLWWRPLIDAAEASGWKHLDSLVWIKPNANPIQGAVLSNAHEYVLLFGQRASDFNMDAVRTPYADESLARLRRRWISSISVKGDSEERNGKRRTERRGERKDANPSGARGSSVFVCETGREKGNPHPAPMPERLAEYLVELASWPGQTILDPFLGSGTTALAARKLGRRSVGIELEPDYCELASRRLAQQSLLAVQ